MSVMITACRRAEFSVLSFNRSRRAKINEKCSIANVFTRLVFQAVCLVAGIFHLVHNGLLILANTARSI